MKRQQGAFFIIALLSELGTTWLQKGRTVTDVAPALCYPNFNTLLLDRFVIWLLIFVVLNSIWLLIVKLSVRSSQ